MITLTNNSTEQGTRSRQLWLYEPIQEHFPGFSMQITLRTKRNCTIWLLTTVRWDFNNTMEGHNTSVPNALVQGPKQECSLSQETKLNTKASPSTKSHITTLPLHTFSARIFHKRQRNIHMNQHYSLLLQWIQDSVYIIGVHYFIWQLSAATSCRLTDSINIAHSAVSWRKMTDHSCQINRRPCR
jgi:hypothetical protein